MKNLEKQIALISGGLGDIGRAIAMELARRGADIAVCDVKPAADAEALLKVIREIGVRAQYQRVDVADAGAGERWVETVERELGLATLIVPNAAIVTLADSLAIMPKQWDHELQINLSGAFYMAQAATRRLVNRKQAGRVVFIGSWAAHAAHPNIPAYCVAKAGLRMLCKCMALQLAPHGILVNEVAPGYVAAGLTAHVWSKTPGARERATERVPTKQVIDPAEVASQVAHLCDPANRHMTGSVVLMDGGLSLTTAASK